MDIFENQDKVINNINESAKNLGIDDKMPKIRKEVRAFAKRNCKRCYGLGGFAHTAPDGKKGTLQCQCVRYFEVQIAE